MKLFIVVLLCGLSVQGNKSNQSSPKSPIGAQNVKRHDKNKVVILQLFTATRILKSETGQRFLDLIILILVEQLKLQIKVVVVTFSTDLMYWVATKANT